MRLYFSGSSMQPRYIHRCVHAIEYRLLSCHGSYVNYLDKWMRTCVDIGAKPQEILLDSGAFTAWSKGEEVRVERLTRTYRMFIRKYEKHTRAIWLINLDRIPGKLGGPEPSPAEIKAAIEESDRNFAVLTREFGARVLPVYHQGEPSSRLAEVEAMADYICVSPRNDLPERLRVEWSRAVHMLTKKKTHGLATTGVQMATTVPWYSTDSAAYVIRAALGMSYFDFGDRVVSVFVSKDSPARYERNKHYLSMSPERRAWLEKRMEENGYTPEELMNDVWCRATHSIIEIARWNDRKRVEQYDAPNLFGV